MKNLSDCRVLVVDDARANVDILVEGLKGDYKLSLALNGETALQAAARNPPDLVLLDIVMPGIDGYEVCRRLRQVPETAEVPIMFLSSLEDVENKARGFEAGANDYLTKPFEMLEVKARVRSLLKAKAYNDAVKELIAGELRVARDIQMGMLPNDFSDAERVYGVHLDAVLHPAREVGGDLYGVWAAGPERLVLFLGDVSGKGIPASMFMVRAVTLARVLAREIAEPERILARLNDELAADNPSGMFVTFICAVFEPATGKLSLANAGQCRPLLLAASEPPRWAIEDLGTALGFETGLEFTRTEICMREGDALILYSDGVNEAFNSEEKCYGNEHLLADAAEFACQPVSAVTSGLLAKVRAFAGSAPQSDDIAILVLKLCRDSNHSAPVRNMTLELHATPEEVMRGVEELQKFGTERGISEKALFGPMLALEECGSNIVNHALDRDSQQKFSVTFSADNAFLSIELRDRGPQFDPTASHDRDPKPADEDSVGGWGIQLVRRYMDKIEYRREGEENVLTLTKKCVAPSTAD